jgi:hypothetical protein
MAGAFHDFLKAAGRRPANSSKSKTGLLPWERWTELLTRNLVPE